MPGSSPLHCGKLEEFVNFNEALRNSSSFVYFEHLQKESSSSSRKAGDSHPKKEKKKSSARDKQRSRAYQYSYESTYLGGGQSRHASLEDMNMHAYGYR